MHIMWLKDGGSMMPRRDPVKEMMGARLYAHPDRGGRGDGTGGDGTVSTDGKKMMFVVPEDLRTALRLRKAKTDKDMNAIVVETLERELASELRSIRDEREER